MRPMLQQFEADVFLALPYVSIIEKIQLYFHHKALNKTYPLGHQKNACNFSDTLLYSNNIIPVKTESFAIACNLKR